VTEPQELAAVWSAASVAAVFSVESPQPVIKANADKAANNGFFIVGFLFEQIILIYSFIDIALSYGLNPIL
jgi:hypothetical protein